MSAASKPFSEVLQFWFEVSSESMWWSKDAAFDAIIKDRFFSVHRAARASELHSWRSEAEGRLAEIIVLDQFSRNLFRDDPAAFSCDGMALALAQEAVKAGALEALDEVKRPFLIMPYMHSESMKIHAEAIELFKLFAPKNLEYELMHKRIIDRFGRYPHRNAVLGRLSSQEEIDFLKQPNSSF